MDFSNVTAVYRGDTPIEAVYLGDVKRWPEEQRAGSKLTLHLTSELTQTLYFTQSAANGVTIDWGDGSEPETVEATSASVSHTFPAAGDYTVTMTAADGVTWSPGRRTRGFLGASPSGSDTTPALTSFFFGDGATFSKNSKFSGCSSLTSIHLPESAKTIGSYAFWRCSALESFSFPTNLTEIGSYAFGYCSSLKIPYIPSGITIGDLAFGYCLSLNDLEVACDNISMFCFGFCSGIKRMWIKSTCTTISSMAFTGCSEDIMCYAEPNSKPSGWAETFNYTGDYEDSAFTVFYGQKTRPW